MKQSYRYVAPNSPSNTTDARNPRVASLQASIALQAAPHGGESRAATQTIIAAGFTIQWGAQRPCYIADIRSL